MLKNKIILFLIHLILAFLWSFLYLYNKGVGWKFILVATIMPGSFISILTIYILRLLWNAFKEKEYLSLFFAIIFLILYTLYFFMRNN